MGGGIGGEAVNRGPVLEGNCTTIGTELALTNFLCKPFHA